MDLTSGAIFSRFQQHFGLAFHRYQFFHRNSLFILISAAWKVCQIGIFFAKFSELAANSPTTGIDDCNATEQMVVEEEFGRTRIFNIVTVVICSTFLPTDETNFK
ncbi:hypothetical protein [Coleofasciculus sp. FACHB-T130]|uniref:hypothetical protein n=1 Tax=Cyanophyceae TaxID=3028117 RepID=UPI0016851863|nr:hypothetical protein [Coleofasciculus sp. FACHB-T130]MBD1881482.1 hypothetical protein [Coleofasciculus sp. FACHB-T130]